MSTLKLVKDETQGKIVAAAIDDKVVDGFVSVSQVFERDKLKATLTCTFDAVEVCTDLNAPDEPGNDVAPTPAQAPELEATFVTGSVENTTAVLITSELGDGNHFAYCVADEAMATPNVGDVAYGTHVYTSGNDIDGVVAGQFVGLFELSAQNAIVKFTAHQLMDSDIPAPAVPAEALEATFAAGTEAGTTVATIDAEPDDGNHYAYKVSDAVIDAPDAGDVVEDATECTSGSSIAGVDAAVNKYVGLYELTADNAVVKFLCHELLDTEIGA